METGRARGLRVFTQSFSRGIVNTIAPDQIPDDAVVDALNCEYDRQHNLRTRHGCARLNWNGNLIGDLYATLDDAGWTKSNVTVTDDGLTSPSGVATSGDALLDTSAAAVGHAIITLAGAAADAQTWGASCFVRLPTDVLDPPAGWDNVIPAVSLEFSGGTTRAGGVALVPDVTAEFGWRLLPTADHPALVDYRIGLTVEDEDDAEFRWFQVILHVRNNDALNVDASIRLMPAYASYAVSGAAITFATNAAGRVTSVVAAVNDPGVGFWGAVLERGRTVERYPNAAGTAATVAANYFTGRVTSVFYYPIVGSSAILATSGSKLYRYVSGNNWFASIGSLSLPSDTLWQWTVFDGECIGVNRDASGVRASATVTAAINFLDGETITVNGQAYTFEDGAIDAAYKVDVGVDLETSFENLAAAINLTGTAGVTYGTGTAIHPTVRATATTATTITLEAITQGTVGNAYTLAEGVADAGCVLSGATFASGAGHVNPVLLTSPSATPTGLDGSPPAGRYITQWNGRVWIVPEDEPSTIRCCKLGDAHDWTNTDAAAGAATIQIDWQSGFPITGLMPYQGVLLVWTRKKILAIIPGQPDNTDLSEYRVETMHVGVGSVSGYAIRSLLEDVVFMSAHGLTSLTMLERLGSFQENGLSRDVAAFGDVEVVNERAVLENYPRKAQLISSFATRLQSRNANVYVMDYRGLAQAQVDGPTHPGFTRATGPMEAASMCLADVSSEERLLIGSETDLTHGIAHVWLYDEDDSYEDEGYRFPVAIITKAYSWGDLFFPKRFHRWEMLFELLEEDVDVNITWRPDLQAAVFQTFSRVLEGQAAVGALWGSAIWGTDLWAASNLTQNVFTGGRFAGSAVFGRSARALQAQIEPIGDASGFVFKGFVLAASWGRELSPRGSGGGFAESHAMITEEGAQMVTGAGDRMSHDDG